MWWQKEVCRKSASLPIWLHNLPAKEGIGFVCVRACSHVSSFVGCVCLCSCECRGDRVCEDEDAQHASSLLSLLFSLCYPTVTGLCWNALHLCVCVFKVCVCWHIHQCVRLTMCLIVSLYICTRVPFTMRWFSVDVCTCVVRPQSGFRGS